jgi:NAD(P)H-dependent FMN reductase
MQITIISGSHRQPSQSFKVASFIKHALLQNKICEHAEILNLANNPLPLWDQGVWDGDEKWNKLLDPIRTQCQNSDAFVIVTPEWHGQVPAGLKNLFLLLSKNEVGHKPAMIVAVSSADGGAYPVAELRMSSYKNNRIVYIPDHVIVRNVEKVLNDNAAENNASADGYFRERIVWTLGVLKEYAVAMKMVRASGNVISKAYSNGM